MSEYIAAARSPPRSPEAKSAFFRLRQRGRMARSTVLVSSSIRPSSRNLSRPSRWFIARMRMLIASDAESDLPARFLAVLVFWVAVLFFGFGLFARFNGTVLVALSVGALSVAGAMYLILELNRPFDGLMRVSEAPLRDALAQMGD